MMQNKIELVIFDLDGTLIDTDKLIFASYDHMFKTYRPDYKVSYEEMLSFLGPTLQDVFTKYFKEDLEELIECYRKHNVANHKRLVNAYPHAYKTLQGLKELNIKVALVTSKRKDVALLGLKQFDLDQFFDCIVSCDMVKSFKPDPEGINYVLKELNVDPTCAIMIGDSTSDLMAGKRANTKIGAINYSIKGKFYEGIECDLIVDDLLDVLEFVKEN